MSSTPARRRAASLAVASLALLVAGCGKDDASAKPTGDTPSPTASSSGVTKGPDDVATTTAPSKSAQPVPKGGPTGIKTFPTPPGARIKGPPPGLKSWQFDILTKDTDAVIAFYRKALPAAGYSIKNDVTKNIGAEVVTYDIEFTGPAHGFIVVVPDEDDVYVVVQSPPQLPDNP